MSTRDGQISAREGQILVVDRRPGSRIGGVTPPAADPRTRGVLVLLAVGVVVWRALAVPPGLLWRDWVLILAAFAAFTVLKPTSRHRPAVTAGVMAFLLGIYVQGQLIHVLTVLGMRP